MYVKLYSSILDSSVWAQDLETRVVWIAMLAMADRDGFVRASPSGLARRANVGPEACAKACATLEAPDPESCNPEHEGRRVEHIEAGWQILNYGLYRTLHDPEVRREQVRQAAKTYRDKKKADRSQRHQPRHQASSDVISGNLQSAQAEAEAKAEAKTTDKQQRASPINLLPNKQQEPTDPDAGLPEQPEPPVPDPIGYLMPLIRQHLYCDTRPPLVSENGKMVRYSEGRDVLILRALLKHRSPEELASAIQGIARLRDSGQLKTLGPQFYPRKPMTMRVLYNTKVLVRGDADLRWAMDAAIRETLETL